MSVKLSGPMVAPRDGGPPTRIVVLLHGYGSDGQDLIGLVPYWRDILPGALFVAPNAPDRCRDNAAGYQWFPVDFSRPERRFEGASRAGPVIAEFLDDIWAETGLGAAETILAGFSQGAMMALHVGVSLDRALLGIVAFSGALLAPAGFGEGFGARPPVCLVHGDRDNVVDPALSAEAAEILRSKGFEVSYHVERGAGHTIAPDGLDFAGQFIARIAAAA
jgi:phospholipase/carboxylesterase